MGKTPWALVGESGCGKSTVGRAIVNILRAMSHGVDISGKVIYNHQIGPIDLAALQTGARCVRIAPTCR